MNSLPLICVMLSELEERDDAYAAVRASAQAIMFREMHNGNVERRLVFGSRAVTGEGEGYEEKSTEELHEELDRALGAILTGFVARVADGHFEISKLREDLGELKPRG